MLYFSRISVYNKRKFTIGNAIGKAGAGLMNFGSSVAQGYQNNRVAAQTQQPANNTQQQTQQNAVLIHFLKDNQFDL